MIQRKYNLNLCLAIGLGAIMLTLALGALQKRVGIFDGADADAIQAAKALRAVPLLTFVMKTITFLGNETGVTIVLCVLYWSGFSSEAATFLLILLFGNIINGHMKEFFELPRPSEHEIKWLSPGGGYGYPSGHTQLGMLYSWLIYSFVEKFWYLCILAGVAMAASRIYLGVHYFSDTVGGFICGLGVVIAATGIYGRVRELNAARETIRNSISLKIALPLALSAVYLFLARGLDGDFQYGGLLAGFFIVYAMLDLKWRPRNAPLMLLTIALGLGVFAAARVGLKAILPANNIGNYMRYFVMGILLAGSPFVFVKFGLLQEIKNERSEGDPGGRDTDPGAS
jgi:membrane-associated phospholipid phosphatase